jgi:hypothetical protein
MWHERCAVVIAFEKYDPRSDDFVNKIKEIAVKLQKETPQQTVYTTRFPCCYPNSSDQDAVTFDLCAICFETCNEPLRDFLKTHLDTVQLFQDEYSENDIHTIIRHKCSVCHENFIKRLNLGYLVTTRLITGFDSQDF